MIVFGDAKPGGEGKNARIGPKREEENEGTEPEDGSGKRGHEVQLRDEEACYQPMHDERQENTLEEPATLGTF